MATFVLYFWSLKMDSSNSPPNLIALALGSHTVDLQEMDPRARLWLVQRILERCHPLKYFPGFRLLTELVNGKHNGFTSETPPGVLTVEVPLGRVFALANLSCKSSPVGGHDEGHIIDRISLLVDDTGKFVLWTERVKKTEGLRGMKVVAEVSRFTLLSNQEMEEILTNPSVVCDLVRELARVAEEDAPKRFERMQRLERADAFLQTLRDRLVVF